MTATAHALVGAFIATKFPDQPFLVFGLSMISHLVMDSIPHWDFGTNWKNRSIAKTGLLAIGDTLFGIALAVTLFFSNTSLFALILGIIGAELPDWLEAPWFIFFGGKKELDTEKSSFFKKICYTIYKTQEDWFHKRAQAPFGIITQIVTVGFFWILVH